MTQSTPHDAPKTSDADTPRHRSVTVVMTVKNDAPGCSVTLESLLHQTRCPDEVIVVDGGSNDNTVATLRHFSSVIRNFRIIQAPGANIAAGRNVGTASAEGEIIASIDGGCRAQPAWLAELIRPFELDSPVDFVAGLYRVEAHNLLEQVVGLATMRGQLEPVESRTFNPSARSMAFTKELWTRAGGWPEWLHFSEDTLFDHRVRSLNASWYLAEGAVVDWRPRGSLRGIARQFYHYGTGRGHTQIDAASFAYNLRNAGLFALTLLCACLFASVWPITAVFFLYFYVWAFHSRARRVARAAGRLAAYPLCILVMWLVLVSNSFGYLVGSWQRMRDRERYRTSLDQYLAGRLSSSKPEWAA